MRSDTLTPHLTDCLLEFLAWLSLQHKVCSIGGFTLAVSLYQQWHCPCAADRATQGTPIARGDLSRYILSQKKITCTQRCTTSTACSLSSGINIPYKKCSYTNKSIAQNIILCKVGCEIFLYSHARKFSAIVYSIHYYYAPVNNTPHYPTPVLCRGIDRELTGVSPRGWVKIDMGYQHSIVLLCQIPYRFLAMDRCIDIW